MTKRTRYSAEFKAPGESHEQVLLVSTPKNARLRCKLKAHWAENRRVSSKYWASKGPNFGFQDRRALHAIPLTVQLDKVEHINFNK